MKTPYRGLWETYSYVRQSIKDLLSSAQGATAGANWIKAFHQRDETTIKPQQQQGHSTLGVPVTQPRSGGATQSGAGAGGTLDLDKLRKSTKEMTRTKEEIERDIEKWMNLCNMRWAKWNEEFGSSVDQAYRSGMRGNDASTFAKEVCSVFYKSYTNAIDHLNKLRAELDKVR